MRMEDEKGLDSKVVIARLGADGRPLHALTADDRQRIGDYFQRYKQHEAGKYSKLPGWGTVAEGRSYVTTTHAFFQKCRDRAARVRHRARAPVVPGTLMAATNATPGTISAIVVRYATSS